jgi:hypothetical protein
VLLVAFAPLVGPVGSAAIATGQLVVYNLIATVYCRTRIGLVPGVAGFFGRRS